MDRFAQIGRLASAAAHDLRNYLGAAGLALSRLQRAEGVEARASMATLQSALDGAGRLTGAMLAYAAGTVPDSKPVELGSVVRRVIELFARTLPERVHTTITIDPVPEIRGVESELEQLVLSLMLDAADAMPYGGQISIAVRANESHVVLGVRHTPSGGRGGEVVTGLGIGVARDVAYRHDARMRITTLPDGGQVAVELPVLAAT